MRRRSCEERSRSCGGVGREREVGTMRRRNSLGDRHEEEEECVLRRRTKLMRGGGRDTEEEEAVYRW